MGEDMLTKIENCPTPQYHQTHRYCPSCPWTEADEAPPCRAVLEHATNLSLRYRCDSYEGHAGPHYQMRHEIGKGVKLEWPAAAPTEGESDAADD